MGSTQPEPFRLQCSHRPLLIAMTGNPDNIPALRAEGPFDVVLAKPVHADQVAKLICER